MIQSEGIASSAAQARGKRVSMLLMVVAAGVLSLMSVGNQLVRNDGDPTVFLTFSGDMEEMREYGERVLEREVIVRSLDGHDGQFYFAQASDPFLLDTENHVGLTDFPAYRAQRLLYPLVAGVGGLLDPRMIVWTLIGVNIVGMALGAFAVGSLAEGVGASVWWGLAFVVNPGFASELILDGSGVLAGALAFSGVLAVRRGRTGYATLLFVLAALAREALLLVPFGAAFWMWKYRERLKAVVMAATPLLVTLIWALYVRIQLQEWPAPGETPNLGSPFSGLIEAFRIPPSDILHPAARVAVLVAFVLYLSRMMRRRDPLLAWSFVGFIPLGFLLTVEVWASYWNITRAVAPLLTALVILWVAKSSPEGSGVSPVSRSV